MLGLVSMVLAFVVILAWGIHTAQRPPLPALPFEETTSPDTRIEIDQIFGGPEALAAARLATNNAPWALLDIADSSRELLEAAEPDWRAHLSR